MDDTPGEDMTMAHKQDFPPHRKPRWLSRRLPTAPEYEEVRSLIRKGGLHTVCEEAKCPNQFECFSRRTATFLILGSRCTRNCRFCNVAHGPTGPPDPEEPRRVADAAQRMGLRYVVVTSVTRDDLPDGGAGLFAETISEIRRRVPSALVEVLIPDFEGSASALQTVLDARPNVLNHNIETVPRLYPQVRPQAVYERSLALLGRAAAAAPDIPTKSGIMLGLGETESEVRKTLGDLRTAGCRFVTIGQYLQPSPHHLPVDRFVPPEEFDAWRERALAMGFSEAASGPFVRSSYHAKDLYQASGL
jgi:lipoic acid synthetase